MTLAACKTASSADPQQALGRARNRGIAIVSAGDARPLVRRGSARPEEPHQFVKAIAVVRR
jgi:hypothetical protein